MLTREQLIEELTKDDEELVEGTSLGDIQRELTYLKSNVSDLEMGMWPVTAKKLHDEALKRAKGIVKMLKAWSP
jgi:hypothetical protein